MDRNETRAGKGDSQDPPNANQLARLARARSVQGDHAGALRAAVHALTMEENPTTQATFVECVRWMEFFEDNDVVRGLLLKALRGGWARPEDLDAQSCDLVRGRGTDLATMAKDELLTLLLTLAPNQDPALEVALTAARRQLLEAVLAGDDTPLTFQAALAQQCFLNEYLFPVAPEELRGVHDIAARVAGAHPTPAQIATLASYRPLSDAHLLDGAWPPAIAALLTQQLREPAAEMELAADIPCLTPLRGAVSRAVQAQYENNPYPRWVMPGPAWRVDGMAQKPADILVAGCGTGRNAIETAQTFPDARVLAVDLSRASLGHAARKSRELRIPNVEFAQADLLEMGDIDRRFDLIEAVGVLHHLADPPAGWHVLLSLLRPGGMMRIGLYSPLARRELDMAHTELKAQGFKPTPAGIRAARQHLMRMPGFGEVVRRPDFFSVSSCRDLLFHVQETYMPLPAIAAFLRENRLKVLGMDLDAPVLLAYRNRFPRDTAATDLDNWAAFETDHPSTFDGMIQFWVQRA